MNSLPTCTAAEPGTHTCTSKRTAQVQWHDRQAARGKHDHNHQTDSETHNKAQIDTHTERERRLQRIERHNARDHQIMAQCCAINKHLLEFVRLRCLYVTQVYNTSYGKTSLRITKEVHQHGAAIPRVVNNLCNPYARSPDHWFLGCCESLAHTTMRLVFNNT